jgi:hypothetical protein
MSSLVDEHEQFVVVGKVPSSNRRMECFGNRSGPRRTGWTVRLILTTRTHPSRRLVAVFGIDPEVQDVLSTTANHQVLVADPEKDEVSLNKA